MTEIQFPAGRDGHLQGWAWPSECAGENFGDRVLILVHGLGDHGGRHRQFADRMNQFGWHVAAFDLPGHGVSPGRRGCVDSFDGVLSDIAEVRQQVRQQFPGAKQVLLGHSMGGNFALNYVLRQEEFSSEAGDLAALVLCAPVLLPPNPPPRPKIFAAWLTGYMLRWLTIRRPVSGKTLSGDPDHVAAIKNDPLMHSRVSIYLATQILSQGRWALDHARELSLPTLIIYGENDSLIDTAACDHLAIRAGEQVQCVKWSGRQHDLLHDVGYEEVDASLAEWLQTHA